jgi:hypothetical protein
MRKTLLILAVAIIALTSAFRPAAVLVKPVTASAVTIVPEDEANPQSMTIAEILELKKSDLKELLGAKPSFKERMAFDMLQQNLKREVKKNGLDPNQRVNFSAQMDEITSGFNAGGFFLGLILGLLGVLGVYIFSKDKNMVRWAWRGWFVWLALLLTAVLLG